MSRPITSDTPAARWHRERRGCISVTPSMYDRLRARADELGVPLARFADDEIKAALRREEARPR